MAHQGSKLGRRVLAALPRIWWGALLLTHVPVFFAVWSAVLTEGPDLSRLGSGIALVVAMAFFALKFQDVSLLRLRTRQQSIVVVCLLTAIVHHGAIAPETDGSLVVPSMVAVVTTGAVYLVIRKHSAGTRDWIRGWAHRLAAGITSLPIFTVVVRRRERMLAARPRRRPVPLSVPRAPPACKRALDGAPDDDCTGAPLDGIARAAHARGRIVRDASPAHRLARFTNQRVNGKWHVQDTTASG